MLELADLVQDMGLYRMAIVPAVSALAGSLLGALDARAGRLPLLDQHTRLFTRGTMRATGHFNARHFGLPSLLGAVAGYRLNQSLPEAGWGLATGTLSYLAARHLAGVYVPRPAPRTLPAQETSGD